jgi:hypothetical protein
LSYILRGCANDLPPLCTMISRWTACRVLTTLGEKVGGGSNGLRCLFFWSRTGFRFKGSSSLDRAFRRIWIIVRRGNESFSEMTSRQEAELARTRASGGSSGRTRCLSFLEARALRETDTTHCR